MQCANIGPADYNYDETISTLRYANRSKCIRNRVKINENPKDAVLRDFQAQIEDLRKQLAEIQQIEHIIGKFENFILKAKYPKLYGLIILLILYVFIH